MRHANRWRFWPLNQNYRLFATPSHYGAERAGALVVPVSGDNTPRQVMLIQDFRPHGIACTPSYALNIADHMAELGLDPRQISLRYGIFGAEPWSESMRQTLEERLNIDAIDIYGLSEIIGPGVACECREAKDGLHINEDHFLPEVIGPATGQPLPPGEFGELVFTTLTKEAFPAIRYRTGGIAALYPEPCRCGRTLVRMSRFKGRVDDMLIIRGVNVFPSEVEWRAAFLLRLRGAGPASASTASWLPHRSAAGRGPGRTAPVSPSGSWAWRPRAWSRCQASPPRPPCSRTRIRRPDAGGPIRRPVWCGTGYRFGEGAVVWGAAPAGQRAPSPGTAAAVRVQCVRLAGPRGSEAGPRVLSCLTPLRDDL